MALVIGWPESIIELIVIFVVVSFLLVSAAIEAWRMISTSSEASLGTVYIYGVGAAIHLGVFLYEFDEPVVSPAAIIAGIGFAALAALLIIELLSLLSGKPTFDHSRPSADSRRRNSS
ncbi:hypothetical protein ACW14X_27970 [Nocardioides sp. YJ-D4]